MSAPWFILSGTCVAFSERRLFWDHTRRSFASMQSHFEMRPPWWIMYDTTDLLSERTSTWCPRMSGRKNWQAWHTATISRQLMCRPDSSSDQRLKVGLSSHNAPQPLLEVSVVTTFLLCAMSRITPRFSQKGSLQQARADTQARVTVTQMEPSASARTGWVACEADPTEVPAKPLPYVPAFSGKLWADRRYLPWRRPSGAELLWLAPLRQLLSSALSR